MNKRGMDFNQLMMLVLALVALVVGILLLTGWGKDIMMSIGGVFG